MFKRLKEKLYFRAKANGVQKMIWDYEFKRAKTRAIREDIRKQYDQDKSKLAIIITQLGKEEKNPTMEKGDLARLEDEKVRLEKDLERWEAQMKGLDLEVEGSKKTQEFPDGVMGINQTLDSLRELQKMVKDYTKRI